jgi:hypothetical protein
MKTNHFSNFGPGNDIVSTAIVEFLECKRKQSQEISTKINPAVTFQDIEGKTAEETLSTLEKFIVGPKRWDLERNRTAGSNFTTNIQVVRNSTNPNKKS